MSLATLISWEQPQALALTKSYPVWRNKILHIPWMRGLTQDIVSKEITYDPTKTRIISARLTVVAAAWDRTHLDFYLNDASLGRMWWGLEGGPTKTETFDVTVNLINGNNVFKVVFERDLGIAWVEATLHSVDLVLEYEGVAPEYKPVWTKYILPAALGAIAVTAIVLLIRR